jgi:hypothetical protein
VTPQAGHLLQSGAFSSVLQQGKKQPRTPQQSQTPPQPPQSSPSGKGKGGKGRNGRPQRSNSAAGRGGGVDGWAPRTSARKTQIYAATVDALLKSPKDNFPLIVNTLNTEYSSLYGTPLFKMTTGKNPSALMPPQLPSTSSCT